MTIISITLNIIILKYDNVLSIIIGGIKIYISLFDECSVMLFIVADSAKSPVSLIYVSSKLFSL